MAAPSTRTVDSGGMICAAKLRSPKPITAMPPGTARLRLSRSATAPWAMVSDLHTITSSLHANDNVAIVVNDGGLPAGTEFPGEFVLQTRVPQGHKIALLDLPEVPRSSATTS